MLTVSQPRYLGQHFNKDTGVVLPLGNSLVYIGICFSINVSYNHLALFFPFA